MKHNHVWLAVAAATPEDAISRYQRLLVLYAVLMGYVAVVAVVVGPSACLPQDPGYPDCPWNAELYAAATRPFTLDVGQLVANAVVCAVLLLPMDRVFVAIFDRVRPPPGAAYADSPASMGWVLPQQLIGVSGQFTHVENVRKAQAAARGYLYRREMAKRGEALAPPVRREEKPVVDKDAMRMYPAPGVKHSAALMETFDSLRGSVRQQQRQEEREAEEAGYAPPYSRGASTQISSTTQLSDYATARLEAAAPPIADAEALVAASRPYPFRYKRPTVLGVDSGGDDGAAHAWEIEPSLLLPSVRATLGPGLPEAQLKILNASAARAGLLEDKGRERSGSYSSYSSYSSSSSSSPNSAAPGQQEKPNGFDAPTLPGEPAAPPLPPGERPGPASLGLDKRLQGGGGARDTPSPSGPPPGGELLSSPSTPPSPSNASQPDDGALVPVVVSEEKSVAFKPPPPPPWGEDSSGLRTRTFRSTNAFALRVIEDEKARQELPYITRVQATYRGNKERKKLKKERAVRMSYQGAPEEGEVAPPFRISHMPPIEEIELTRERARVATPRGAGKAAAKYSVDSGKGKGKGKGKDAGPQELAEQQRSRFTDLAALPVRPFRPRKRKTVRRKPDAPRASAERYPEDYTRLAYGSVACWMVLCAAYTTVLGVSFDLNTTLRWACTVGATMGWQALVQQPLLVVAAILSSKLLETVRGLWFELAGYLPFQI